MQVPFTKFSDLAELPFGCISDNRVLSELATTVRVTAVCLLNSFYS